MKKIIVTGGLGFIGSNLIKLLLNLNYRVLNLDKVSYASNFYNTKSYVNHKNYTFVKCDLCNYKKLNKIIYNFKPDGIFNLAAESHVDRSIDGPRAFIDSNIVGVFNLLEVFKLFIKKKIIVNYYIYQQMRFTVIFLRVDQVKSIHIYPALRTQQAKLLQII